MKLRQKSTFDDINNKWTIPTFFMKEKEVNLPKIKNAEDLVQQELDNHELVISNGNGKPKEKE